ncbi:hypothetical protein NP233_g2536 [Leucocoprinus birnbaumii]|uniref:Nephrocystin 3-like N-terminal domain-containing protein n=1 Tax=Leucocoprinus birnbaumii TaxID=56174 RepID=A0AAD5YZ01_9AGAR|nr:hypothetical protein NP233_g2536 [Leucocoprinus birnbaumii]
MYDINETKEKALQWLTEFTMSGAEFDSSIRDPPPRCHPGTRIPILSDISPAGVGKTAIVQSLAEELSTTSKLDATLFISRTNHCHDATRIFPTTTYQLAVRIPLHRAYLKQTMIDDPRILEKGIKHQFRTLVVEPFVMQLTQELGSWLILLDGLDECENEETLVIELISEICSQHPSSALNWLISSRPEPHLCRV